MKEIDQIKEIAFLYRQNRDSQKFACKNIIFKYNGISYEIKPFNMDKYSNPKTIEKRLSPYDEIIAFEYDYDIKEALDKLTIKYQNFVPSLSIGFLDHWRHQSIWSDRDDEVFMKKPKWDFSNEIIEKTIFEMLGLKRIVTTYYVAGGEIKEKKIQLEPNKKIFNDDKKQVAKDYIKNITMQTELMEATVFRNKERIKEFNKKYKELLEEK